MVLPSAAAGSTFTVTATMPPGVSARQADAGVKFVDSAGTLLMTYTNGMAFDATATAALGDVGPEGSSTPVMATLVKQARDNATIQITMDAAWLHAPDRVFPVVVDPSADTTYSGRDDLYLNSDNPNNPAPTGGPEVGVNYDAQDHLRLGNKTSAGTARIFPPFDDDHNTAVPFTAPIGYTYANEASLHLHVKDSMGAPSSGCTATAAVYDITSPWVADDITWSQQPQLDDQTSGGYPVTYLDKSQSVAPRDGWQSVASSGWVALSVTNDIAQIFNGSGWDWHGLEISPNPESFNSVTCWREFDSAETDNAPRLVAYYNPISVPTTTSSDNGKVLSQSNMEDPVDVVTGNLKEPATDLSSPNGVFGLDWTRTFNSYDAERSVSPGGLGVGWSSSFYPTLQGVTGGVQMKAPDGRAVTWSSNGSGVFTRPYEYPADLSGTNGAYHLRFDDGVTWDFDAQNRLSTMTTPSGQTLTIDRDVSGHLTTVVSSTGAQLGFSYGTSGYGNGQVVSVVGPAGTVRYGYDVAGNLVAVTGPGGKTTTYGYDSSHRLTSITDPTGVVSIVNIYDSAGRVATQKHASGGTTTFSYGTYDSVDGLWETVVTDSVTGTSGRVTFFYNKSKEVVRVEDNLPNASGGTGNVMLKDFADSLGDLTSATSRSGGQANMVYDDTNHLLCAAQPGGTCPAAGAALDSGSGPYTAYAYDGQTRLSEKYVNGSGATTYTYTGSDRLPTTVTDALGDVTTYVIANGLIAQETDPDGVVTSYSYDAAGRMLSKTIGGNATTYTYDAAGRQTCAALPGGSCPDAQGTGGSGSYTATSYDAAGLIESTRAADGEVTSYTYDAAGRVLTVTDPTGTVTTNHYDAPTGLLMSVDKPGQIVDGVQQYVTTRYAYDANGNQTCVALPGGTCPNASGAGGWSRTR